MEAHEEDRLGQVLDAHETSGLSDESAAGEAGDAGDTRAAEPQHVADSS